MNLPPQILVVDDDARMREMVTEILVEEGFAVHLAGGVDEALRMLAVGDVALVITDLQMSPRSGLDLLTEIGAPRPDPPTILMTASLEHNGQILTEDYGLAGFLRKPFRQKELVKLVSELLIVELDG